MKYETIKFNVGNEEYDVIHCLGDGQCECKSCKDKGKWSLSWTSWFYKLNETDENVLCRNCLAEILIQRRIDKAIKDKIEQGTLIELPYKDLSAFPCEMGATVWLIYKRYWNVADKNGFWVLRESKVSPHNKKRFSDDFGKFVFLTREEAEKRLKELQV